VISLAVEERKEVMEEKTIQGNGYRYIVDHILDSYEARVKVVAEVMRETTALLKRLSEEQAEMALHLRDVLAKKESLRKKDFDSLLKEIVVRNLDREKEVNEILEGFQIEQGELIARFRDILTGNEKIKLSDFRALSKQILERLDRREKEISDLLRSFHIEQEEVAASLRKLVEKGQQVRTRDLKTMIESLKLRRLERGGEVGHLLNALGKVQEEVKLRWEKVLQGYV